MECPECGAVISEEDLFCGECGAVLAPSLSDLSTIEPGTAPEAEPPQPPAAVVAPDFGPAVHDTRANAAFILGIVSVGLAVISCIPFISFVSCMGPVTGIIAIILGVIVKRDVVARHGLEEDQKKAHQGLILGIVGFVLYFVMSLMGLMLGIGISFLSEM